MYKEQEALLLWDTKHEKGKIPLWGKTNDISTASAFKEAGMIILERECRFCDIICHYLTEIIYPADLDQSFVFYNFELFG